MLRTHRRFRFLALGAAVFQLTVPPMVSYADAIVAATDGMPSVVHIEDHGHKGCRPGYPFKCALCQTLSHWSAPLPQDATLLQRAGRAPIAPTAMAPSGPRSAIWAPHSRGPPA